MDIFAELKNRADREIEGLREASAKTDDTNEKYKYRKIRVGIEAMLEHIYEVENEFKVRKAYENEAITNADKIRSMSDEELASMLIEYVEPRDVYYCSDCEFFNTIEDAIKHEIEYLQSEAE